MGGLVEAPARTTHESTVNLPLTSHTRHERMYESTRSRAVLCELRVLRMLRLLCALRVLCSVCVSCAVSACVVYDPGVMQNFELRAVYGGRQ